MTEQGPQGVPLTEPTVEAQRLAGTVLVRVAAEPGEEALVARDLATILGARGGADLWRIELGRLLAALTAGGLIARTGSALTATATGVAAASEFLGLRKGYPSDWETARDRHLIAKALDLNSAPASRLKLLGKPDGLRWLIVARHWQLDVKGSPSASRLRSALAVKALEQAFGNQIGTGLGEKSSLPAKAGRLLAAQLSTSGREFGTDGRLIAALAAEAVGASRSDVKSLQIALLKRFLGRAADLPGATKPTRRKLPLRQPTTDASHVTPDAVATARTEAVPPPKPGRLHAASPATAEPAIPQADRPAPAAFAAAVLAATDETAEGWAGNRKAFISKVWALIQSRHASWALSEIEFKCMLTEAHRTGLVALANADLKDKRALKELQDSAVVYKNTVWHYVRAAG